MDGPIEDDGPSAEAQRIMQTHTARLGPMDTFTISHCLRSELLPCGCLLGVYETYGGRVLRIIDEHGPRCDVGDHARDIVLDPDASAA